MELLTFLMITQMKEVPINMQRSTSHMNIHGHQMCFNIQVRNSRTAGNGGATVALDPVTPGLSRGPGAVYESLF